MNGYLRSIAAPLVLLALTLGPWSAAEAGSQDSTAPGSSSPAAVGHETDKTYNGHKISLEFKDADFLEVIRHISDVSGKTIVISDDLNSKLTCKLIDMPWDQALDMILSSRSLGFEESGDVLTVYELPILRNFRPSCGGWYKPLVNPGPQLPPLAKKVFTPKHTPVNEVSAELTKLKSSRGKLVTIDNDIYVEDDPGSISVMTQIFMRTERNRQTAND